MRIAAVIIFIFLSSGILHSAAAQQQLFKNYTVNDGLVSNSIRKIFQDSKGFLWIGTIEGLSKYDGATFTNYTTANGLSHNLVNDIYESKNGQIYIILNNGSIDKIENEINITNTDSSGIVVNKIIHTPWHKTIAVTDAKGLMEFSDGKLTQPLQDFPKATFNDIEVINDTSLLVTGENFIRIFNKAYQLIGGTNEGYNVFSDIKVYQDSKKRIWLGSIQGLRNLQSLVGKSKPIRFAALASPFNTPSLQNVKINDIFEDADHVLWFATDRGVMNINPDGSSQIITSKDGLISNIVNTIFQDKEKNIWFGTEGGLSKLVTQSGITLYPIENGVASNDNTCLLYSINENNFLISTSKGVELFNKITGNFQPVANGRNLKITSVVSYSETPLFIGETALFEFDPLHLQFKRNSSLSGISAFRMVRDKAGVLFSGDGNHLYFTSGSTLHTLLPDRISALLIDKSGDLWAGTWSNGLFRITYKVVDSGLQIIATRQFLPKEKIRCLLEDSKGNIWAGTRYKGVYALRKAQKDSFVISNLNQAGGLSSNFIKVISEDSDGNFWIAFYDGIDKLIKTEKGFRIFNFSRVYHYFIRVVGLETDADHTIWVATNEGLVRIKDAQLENLPPLPVYITGIFTQDSSYSPGSKNLQFGYDHNQVRFEFSAPGFINETQLLYSYRLSGNSPAKWSAPSNLHEVSYASLEPSNYRFEVRTLGWNGAWGTPAILEFVVQPPFWKTGWFISLVSLCILALAYLFIKWRIKNLRIIDNQKLKVQELNAGQYKNKLELEQIINYFSSSLIEKNTIDEVLWDVAKNLIGRLGFVDCMIYLWNSDKTKMIQSAGFGPKGSIEEIKKQHFDVMEGQGIVGFVMQTKEAVLVSDTSKDNRYRADDVTRLSEIAVPVIYNKELIGIIDSEHHERNFFTGRHLQILNTIATLTANKIKSIEATQLLEQKDIEMYRMKEQLSKAKLEALRSQMNPHFIFNCINSIDALIHSNDKYNATVYLNKFAKLLRNILDGSNHDTVSFSRDIDTLKLYIELEELRNENKFRTDIKIDRELLDSDYKVPPLIVQPFVENAIMHGLKNKEGNEGVLMIDIKKIENKIRYIITDNGIGRAAARQFSQNKESHYGMQLSNDRINLFNADENAAVEIVDMYEKENVSGTKVIVNLNII